MNLKLLIGLAFAIVGGQSIADGKSFYKSDISIERQGVSIMTPHVVTAAGSDARAIIKPDDGSNSTRLDYSISPASLKSVTNGVSLKGKIYERRSDSERWVLASEFEAITKLDADEATITAPDPNGYEYTIRFKSRQISEQEIKSTLPNANLSPAMCPNPDQAFASKEKTSSSTASLLNPQPNDKTGCCHAPCAGGRGELTCCGVISCCGCGNCCEAPGNQ